MIKGTRTNTKLEMRLSKSRRRRLEAICLSSRSMLLLIFFVAWFILLGTSPQYTHVVMAALSPTSSGTGTRETETETTIRRGRRATTTATAKNANSLPRQNQKDRNDRRRKGEDKIKVLGGGGGLEGDNEREASKQGDKKFLVNKNKKMYNNQRLKKEEAVQIRQVRDLPQCVQFRFSPHNPPPFIVHLERRRQIKGRHLYPFFFHLFRAFPFIF